MRPGEEVLIVGGEDHKTGQQTDMAERLDRLVEWTRERFPIAGEVVYRWSGQVQESADAMGYIGAHPGEENLYVITGDSGQGMTHGTLGAMLVTDLISGRENSWAKLYDPGRSGLSEPLEMARENLNAVTQFADYLAPGEVRDVSEIPNGQGAVVRRGTKQFATYRDENGVLYERSAACTHLGCVVHWNPFEKSWDCPCHGSRFHPTGHVLTAPASAPRSEPGD
jgi:Rieske Fe-S protein